MLVVAREEWISIYLRCYITTYNQTTTMKKHLFMLLIAVLSFGFAANAQSGKKDTL